MKLFLLLVLVFSWEIRVWGDQLFTFRGQPIQTNRYGRNSRQIVCITDNPLDAITWNTPLRWADPSLSFNEKHNITGIASSISVLFHR